MTKRLSIAQERSGADVAVVIISFRETTETLYNAIAAALRALKGFNAVLDVVVNGNAELAESVAGCMRDRCGEFPAGVRLRCWYLVCGDKAHAWNTYVHELWPGARTTVFMDGYVEAAVDAIQLLDDALAEDTNALGATGVPNVGASARRMQKEMTSGGGIHGNLFALGADAMRLIRNTRFFVPLGLYRVDGVIGAALFKQLQPIGTTWDIKRVVVLPAVSWRFGRLKWWRLRDWIAYIKRLSRQQQGVLENLAFRDFFIRRKQPLDKLPRTALTLLEDWERHAPDEASSTLRRSSAARRALERMRLPRDWSQAAAPPVLMVEISSMDVLHSGDFSQPVASFDQ
ncbi:conserved protein of unknown function [Thauera humireducens]|jgi:hypothetical protein|uniref:hypothetical protein n=1 Tax=Thauera humireducens TaxID=1134435 RepID=UPI002467A096|nr:hypothetical protein [Thauera humireducens]CAH1747211.1 conserved protein of unknown function [Thauera humireducens]